VPAADGGSHHQGHQQGGQGEREGQEGGRELLIIAASGDGVSVPEEKNLYPRRLRVDKGLVDGFSPRSRAVRP
jgi:hypothetical protein